jgi:4-oxalomesaconate tautomerase
VGVDSQITDSSVQCGNGAAALPLYATNQGWVNTPGKLRAYNETTGEYLDFTWGSTPKDVSVTLHNPCGQNTSALYPTKNTQDKIYIPQFDSEIPVTILNAVGPIIFARAADLLLTGFETPQELTKQNLTPIIETIREEACNLVGLEYNANATVPKFCLIAPPTNGAHLAVRYFTPHEPHPSLAVSASIALGAALLTKGTILNELCPKDTSLSPAEFSIEHPAGTAYITLDYKFEGELPHIQWATYQKSARALMIGDVWEPWGENQI